MNDIEPTDTGGLLAFIERASRDEKFSAEKYSALLDRQMQLMEMHSLRLFNADHARMQAEIEEVKASGKNPTFNNWYPKLIDLDRAAREVYTRYGFSVRYGIAAPPREGWMTITLILSHSGGYSEILPLPIPIDYQPPEWKRARTPVQAVGSTVTYARRILLQMALNLVTKDPADDDGEGQRPASRPVTETQRKSEAHANGKPITPQRTYADRRDPPEDWEQRFGPKEPGEDVDE